MYHRFVKIIDTLVTNYYYKRQNKTKYMFEKIKKNFSMISVLFAGAWFLMTLFCNLLAYIYYAQYFETIKLDKSFIFYEDLDLKILLFVAAFIIIFLCLLFYLSYLGNYFVLSIIGIGLFSMGEYINKLEFYDNFIKWCIFCFSRLIGCLIIMLALLLVIFAVICKVQKATKYERKVFEYYKVLFIIICAFFLIRFVIYFANDSGKNYLYFNDVVQLMYEDKDNGDRQYYIMLWQAEGMMYMRQIDYDEDSTELIIKNESGIITREYEKYQYFSKRYENIVFQ